MKALLYIAGLFGAFALGWTAGRCSLPAEIRTERDTLTVRDTVRISVPELRRVTVVRRDTVRLPAVCSPGTAGADTAEVVVPVTQKVYGDSTYRAYVSGYRAKLDSIFISRPTVVVRERTAAREKPPRFSLSLQAGVGAVWSGGRLGFGPYVGAGVSVRIGK